MLTFPFLIDLVMITLLALTILYCIRLNRQLTQLRADETTLKSTIKELMSATGLAEKAVNDLRHAMHDYKNDLEFPMREGQTLVGQLREQVSEADFLYKNLVKENGRPIHNTNNLHPSNNKMRQTNQNIEKKLDDKINPAHMDRHIKHDETVSSYENDQTQSTMNNRNIRQTQNQSDDHYKIPIKKAQNVTTDSEENEDLSAAARAIGERLRQMKRNGRSSAA